MITLEKLRKSLDSFKEQKSSETLPTKIIEGLFFNTGKSEAQALLIIGNGKTRPTLPRPDIVTLFLPTAEHFNEAYVFLSSYLDIKKNVLVCDESSNNSSTAMIVIYFLMRYIYQNDKNLEQDVSFSQPRLLAGSEQMFPLVHRYVKHCYPFFKLDESQISRLKAADKQFWKQRQSSKQKL